MSKHWIGRSPGVLAALATLLFHTPRLAWLLGSFYHVHSLVTDVFPQIIERIGVPHRARSCPAYLSIHHFIVAGGWCLRKALLCAINTGGSGLAAAAYPCPSRLLAECMLSIADKNWDENYVDFFHVIIFFPQSYKKIIRQMIPPSKGAISIPNYSL